MSFALKSCLNMYIMCLHRCEQYVVNQVDRSDIDQLSLIIHVVDASQVK